MIKNRVKTPQIIHDDPQLLVINKPAGLMVHADGKPRDQVEPTVVDWLVENYPAVAGVGEPDIVTDSGQTIARPGIVHRLDKDTSGIMVIAKDQTSYEFLKQQFQERGVQKVYRAVVYGQPRWDQRTVDAGIGRAKQFGKWTAIPKALRKPDHVREAETEFVVLERLGDYSYVEARPKTGRTHQIRVHLQYLNHPVVGDVLYAGKKVALAEVERQLLHAYQLTLVHPGGEEMSFEAALPDDMLSFQTKTVDS